jgi:hypothetical protein
VLALVFGLVAALGVPQEPPPFEYRWTPRAEFAVKFDQATEVAFVSHTGKKWRQQTKLVLAGRMKVDALAGPGGQAIDLVFSEATLHVADRETADGPAWSLAKEPPLPVGKRLPLGPDSRGAWNAVEGREWSPAFLETWRGVWLELPPPRSKEKAWKSSRAKAELPPGIQSLERTTTMTGNSPEGWRTFKTEETTIGGLDPALRPTSLQNKTIEETATIETAFDPASGMLRRAKRKSVQKALFLDQSTQVDRTATIEATLSIDPK